MSSEKVQKEFTPLSAEFILVLDFDEVVENAGTLEFLDDPELLAVQIWQAHLVEGGLCVRGCGLP